MHLCSIELDAAAAKAKTPAPAAAAAAVAAGASGAAATTAAAGAGEAPTPPQQNLTLGGELASAEASVQAALERSALLERALEQLTDALTAYQRLARDPVRSSVPALIVASSLCFPQLFTSLFRIVLYE